MYITMLTNGQPRVNIQMYWKLKGNNNSAFGPNINSNRQAADH